MIAVVDLTRGVRCRVESLSRPDGVSALRVLAFRFPKHPSPFSSPFSHPRRCVCVVLVEFKIALGHGETEDRHTANNGPYSSFSISCVLYANRSSTLPLVVLRFLSSSDALERPTQNDRTRSVTFLKASARAKKFASKIGPHVFLLFSYCNSRPSSTPLVFHTQRKTGLFKKAYELGVLCSVDVAVIIFGIVPSPLLSPISFILTPFLSSQSTNLVIQISFSNTAQPT